ncbi:MAG: translocation/assembly module TamB domain-containing protein, partial [Bacteroidia bacterium]
GNTLLVPENIATLGVVNFKGKFTGFLNDFVAYGNINTAIGYLSSDLNLKINEDKSSSYSGRLAASNFDLGRYFYNEQLLGKVTFDVRLRGAGLTLDRIRAQLDGNISSITLNNYTYTNVGVNGQFSKNEFKGQLAVNDQNIDLDFNGSVNFSGRLPVFDFTAELKRADLAGLKLIKSDTTALLATSLVMHFTGNKLGNFEGSVKATNTTFNNGQGIYGVENISLISGFENGDRTLIFLSDILDAKIKGSFDLEELPGSFENLIAQYINTYPDVENKGLSYQIFTFEAELKETTPVISLFVPKLNIKPETFIKGNYNSGVSDFELQLISPGISYDNFSANAIKLNAGTAGGKINAELIADKLFTGNEVLFDSLRISSTSQSTGVRTNLYALSGDTNSTKLDVTGDLTFTKSSRYSLSLLPGEIIINNTPWNIISDNEITIDTSFLAFRNFALSHQQQSVSVNGIVSDDPDDKAVLQFINFDLNNFKPILSTAGVDIGGIVNGQAEIASAFKQFKVNADITVSNFTFTGDTLGTLVINTFYDNTDEVVEANIAIIQSTIKNIEVKGKYFITRKENNLDFDIAISKLYMTIFQPYVKGTFSNIRGVLSADLKLAGTLANPELTGTANLQKTTFIMDYLQTHYTFSHNVVFTKDYIGWNNLVLYDVYGNQSVSTGKIHHRNFKQERVEITVAANKFMVLNTKPLDNSLFYGTGFTTGLLNISGTFSNLIMEVAARTERGTQIHIPLSNPDEVYSSNFIRFVQKDTAVVVPPVYVADLSGLQLNIDLEVTPDAEIQLIFDDKIGDILRGTGTADIRMGIDFLGDFKMYGAYTVESGDYLFTLQNVINKRFRLEQGGIISWNGDPYDADVNLFAIYRARAALQDLFGETDSVSRRVPVNIRMHLTNKLMNPNVAFNIEVPNSDPTVESQMRNVISSDQEMNRQVFSLLVMNRFAPPTGFSTSYTAGAAANISELLSNQFSNWFSQIVPNFDFGVNYRAGDAISSEELEVLLSTELFNDRIVIDGNLGLARDAYNSNIVGDFTVEYKASTDGRFRIKAFNRSNSLNLLNDRAPYTQGVGVFYREEFDSLKELINRYGRKKESQPPTEEALPEEDDISKKP